MLLKTFSRKGGKARSALKTAANRAKAASYWESVRAGRVPPPRRHRKPPTIEDIAKRLAPFCRRHGITRLEIFGSIARGEARPGSDIDLLATFAVNPGLRFFAMEDEAKEMLKMPVHFLSRESVETMSNPFRRDSILADARVIYHAKVRR